MSPISTLPDWLAQGMSALRDGDIAGFLDLYAPDAVHEFPFAPPGAPRELVGHDAIAAFMSQLPTRIRFGDLSDIRVRETGDEVIVEATGHHHRLSDNSPRDISYVWFITRAEGKITHFRDYMNPLQLSQV